MFEYDRDMVLMKPTIKRVQHTLTDVERLMPLDQVRPYVKPSVTVPVNPGQQQQSQQQSRVYTTITSNPGTLRAIQQHTTTFTVGQPNATINVRAPGV